MLQEMIEMYIGSEGFTGTIPTHLGWLSSLEMLSFFQNNLSGTIPSEFGLLTSLTNLSLGLNSLTGTVPSALDNFNGYLDLSYNDLTGCDTCEGDDYFY
jgi:Leucine-rich repeat (LRR) protein